ncbi:MAG: hypothetical protein AAF443_03210 [Chlamydiota bacterium]
MSAIPQTPTLRESYSYLQPVFNVAKNTYHFISNHRYTALAVTILAVLGYTFIQEIKQLIKKIAFNPAVSSSVRQVVQKLNSLDAAFPPGLQLTYEETRDLLEKNPVRHLQPIQLNALRDDLMQITDRLLPFIPSLWNMAKGLSKDDTETIIDCYTRLIFTTYQLQEERDSNDNYHGICIDLLEATKGNLIAYKQALDSGDPTKLKMTSFDYTSTVRSISKDYLTPKLCRALEQKLKQQKIIAEPDLDRWENWIAVRIRNDNDEYKVVHDLIIDLTDADFCSLVMTIQKHPRLFARLGYHQGIYAERIRTKEYNAHKKWIGECNKIELCYFILYFEKYPEQFAHPALIMAMMTSLRGNNYDHYENRTLGLSYSDIHHIDTNQLGTWENKLPKAKRLIFSAPGKITPQTVQLMPDGVVLKFAQLDKEAFEQPGAWEAIEQRASQIG